MVRSSPQKEKGAQHFHFSVYLSGLVQHLYLTLKIIASNQSLNVFSHSSGSCDETVKGTERERENDKYVCECVPVCVRFSICWAARLCPVGWIANQSRADRFIMGEVKLF